MEPLPRHPELERAERELQAAREQLSAALEIHHAVAGHLDRQALFTAVAEAIERVSPARGVLLLLPSSDPAMVKVYAAHRREGFSFYEGESIPRDTSMGGWVVANHVRMSASRVEEIRERFPVSYERMRREGMESILTLPLMVAGRCMGALTLLAEQEGAWTSVPETLLEEIAASVAVALSSSIAYEEVTNLRDELRALLDVNRAVTRHLRRDELFAALARSLGDLVPFDRFGIELPVDGDRLRAHILAAPGHAPGAIRVEEMNAAGTACRWVERERTWYVAPSRAALRDRFPVTDQVMAREGMESLLALPLVTERRSLGVLFFMAAQQDRYTEIGRGLLDQVASAVAVALDNCLAYEELGALRDRLAAENVYLREEIRQDHDFRELVGRSPALLELLSDIGAAAPTDSTVLILGETGTGKELIARAIHDRSRRRDRPLVKVNCSAISAGLVESELFGHVRGAFTGALTARVGRFELADQGTLFLDEIGDLPLETQVKLLRVLQEREFEPVGSNSTRRVDVRVIAATNRDLDRAVEDGTFRADLFYRLNVLPLRVPALRDRTGDIPLLVYYFVERCARELGKTVEGVSPEAMDTLTAYSWPGNVRELQNVVERAVVLARRPAVRIDRDLLPGLTLPAPPPSARAPIPTSSGGRPQPPSPAAGEPPPLAGVAEPLPLEAAERMHIEAALTRCGWRIEGPHGAAAELAIHPSTLRSRMKKLGLQRRALR
jgi:formate hydrogenlyase transcriptional activator